MKDIIARSKNNQYSFNQFIQDIKKKTNKAIYEDHVIVHCILIYSKLNPIISKIINDKYLYQALDEISNRYINIYHADATLPDEKFTTKYISTIGELNIYNNNDTNNTINRRLKNMFNLKITDNNPALLLFQLDGENIVNSFCIEIREQNEQETFFLMKEILNVIIKAIESISKNNINNQKEIFSIVKKKLKKYTVIKKLTSLATNPLVNIALALKP